MLKVGLTGGYATGKSFVASKLAELGCFVVAADKLGHAVLQPDGEAYRPALEAFGRGILAPDESIDRRKLAAIVFASPPSLETLNRFVHPAVFRLEEAMLDQFRASSPNGIAVVEAAILIETGRYRTFDRLVLTTCSDEAQIRRGMHRDGLTREEILMRLSRQLPASEKQRFAHFVIDTDGPKEATALRVREVYGQLRALAEGESV